MREPGCYWTKKEDEDWKIRFFNGEYWTQFGDVFEYPDSDFQMINENKITRNQNIHWKTHDLSCQLSDIVFV